MKLHVLAVALLLAGCSGGLLAPSGGPAKLYTLSAPHDVISTAPQANWQLAVEMPEAELELNTARIAVAPSPARIDYYADVAWADRPPAMLQELLVRSFEKSGKIAAVDRRGSNVRADFELTTDLQHFQVEAAGDPADVHVDIMAHLIRTRDRAIVASRHFEMTAPAGTNFDATISGFDETLRQLLPMIVDWTLEQGNRNS